MQDQGQFEDTQDEIDSEERREALRAIATYAKYSAGAAVVVLSSSQAVKAHASSVAHRHRRRRRWWWR